MPLVTVNAEYNVGNGPVVLDVAVGDGHQGDVRVSVDGQELGHDPRIQALTVGQGPALRGKTLEIIASAVVVNAQPGRASIEVRLDGALVNVPPHQPISVGDVIDFEVYVEFE